jgi:hypothetical protein
VSSHRKYACFFLRSSFILVLMLTQRDGSIVPYGYQCLNDGNKVITSVFECSRLTLVHLMLTILISVHDGDFSTVRRTGKTGGRHRRQQPRRSRRSNTCRTPCPAYIIIVAKE